MKNILTLILLASCVIVFTSCEDEPVTGCTNAEAENYNSLASEDDGNCVFARDKFLDEYEGKIKCNLLIQDSTAYTMVVTEGLSGNNAVEIEFKETTQPLPIISAIASGDSLILVEKTYVFSINDTPTDVDVSGFAIIDGDNLDGTLNATLTGTSFQDQCGFIGVKKQ